MGTKRSVAPRNKGGRPKHKRDKQIAGQVLAYSSILTPHHDIAFLVGLSTKTLLKYYDKELQQGAIRAKLVGRRKLFERVNDGEPWAIQMLLKCKDGWTETQALDVTHRKPPNFGITFEDGGPGSANPAAASDDGIEVSGKGHGSDD